MSQPTEATPAPLRATALGAVVVLLVVLAFAAVISLRSMLVSVFLGLLLATALRPLMSRLREGRMPLLLAASTSLMALIGAVVGFLVLAVPLLVVQAQGAYAALPGLYAGLHAQLARSQLRVLRLLAEHMPPALPTMSAGSPADLSASLIALLPAAGYSLFVTVGTLLFSYYWLLYRDRSLRGLLLLLPMGRRGGVEAIWAEIESRIGAFLRGQALLALVTGAFSLVGYWLIGLPYALLIALVAAVLEFVPFLGPIIATLVAVIIGLSESPQLGLSALVAGIIIQQLENNFLAPRIMDKAVGISPVVTLLAFVGFAALFGPAGGLLAIPLAAVLQVLFLAWLERDARAATAGAVGRSLADRLRYATRDLARDIAVHLRQKDADASAEADTAEEDLEQLLSELDDLLAGRSAPRAADAPLAELEQAAAELTGGPSPAPATVAVGP